MLKFASTGNSNYGGDLMTAEGYIRLGLGIVIVVMIAIILYRFNAGKGTRRRTSLEIMKERYEKGEITEKEYEKARKKQGK
ncbi:SHOCT domain-containing protein [Lentibacillus amyloliquefaciens]|nr:SHOCT domain-containing protein [Lentibacillus amyloliquefaciens]